MASFTLKEDSSEIVINGTDVEEIVPDADFRFSLLVLKNGEKHFVTGTKEEIESKLEANAL
ncbi:hypothetical protein [Dyadobacter sp. CY347]|uniref:hypothetical protein n=1 Tax=Dyadobacter sp. CY347 TaxID=2909336 RepID=UPI001F29BD78|nr:hypothetical protein [Dyadobacter sp. CY347]MCF2489386.1 hypothetical protein [Dyadobacter sp. CY347]